MQEQSEEVIEAYQLAQEAISNLKTAVRIILDVAGTDGLRNVDIGKTLGIYSGHIRHEGHISSTILAIMEADGSVEQDTKTQVWTLNNHLSGRRQLSRESG